MSNPRHHCEACGRPFAQPTDPATLSERIGANVRAARIAAGHSQGSLGAVLSPPLSHAAVSDVEHGKVRPDLGRVVGIAAALGVPWRSLLDGIE